MKAIILSAGKGSRLLPLTEDKPKCLLPVGGGYTLLGWQLAQLEQAGVREAVVVTGFNTQMVEDEIAAYNGRMSARALYNPFYHVADNLGSVWMARGEMADAPFMILNGDTLFTADVARNLIAGAAAPITLCVAEKDSFDDDDMKVIRDGAGRLHRVSKKLEIASGVNAESIGMMVFQKAGAQAFTARVENLMKTAEGTKVFYLSVIDSLASELEIGTVTADQDLWQEVDFPADYEAAKAAVAEWLPNAVLKAATV